MRLKLPMRATPKATPPLPGAQVRALIERVFDGPHGAKPAQTGGKSEDQASKQTDQGPQAAPVQLCRACLLP